MQQAPQPGLAPSYSNQHVESYEVLLNRLHDLQLENQELRRANGALRSKLIGHKCPTIEKKKAAVTDEQAVINQCGKKAVLTAHLFWEVTDEPLGGFSFDVVQAALSRGKHPLQGHVLTDREYANFLCRQQLFRAFDRDHAIKVQTLIAGSSDLRAVSSVIQQFRSSIGSTIKAHRHEIFEMRAADIPVVSPGDLYPAVLKISTNFRSRIVARLLFLILWGPASLEAGVPLGKGGSVNGKLWGMNAEQVTLTMIAIGFTLARWSTRKASKITPDDASFANDMMNTLCDIVSVLRKPETSAYMYDTIEWYNNIVLPSSQSVIGSSAASRSSGAGTPNSAVSPAMRTSDLNLDIMDVDLLAFSDINNDNDFRERSFGTRSHEFDVSYNPNAPIVRASEHDVRMQYSDEPSLGYGDPGVAIDHQNESSGSSLYQDQQYYHHQGGHMSSDQDASFSEDGSAYSAAGAGSSLQMRRYPELDDDENAAYSYGGAQSFATHRNRSRGPARVSPPSSSDEQDPRHPFYANSSGPAMDQDDYSMYPEQDPPDSNASQLFIPQGEPQALLDDDDDQMMMSPSKPDARATSQRESSPESALPDPIPKPQPLRGRGRGRGRKGPPVTPVTTRTTRSVTKALVNEVTATGGESSQAMDVRAQAKASPKKATRKTKGKGKSKQVDRFAVDEPDIDETPRAKNTPPPSPPSPSERPSPTPLSRRPAHISATNSLPTVGVQQPTPRAARHGINMVMPEQPYASAMLTHSAAPVTAPLSQVKGGTQRMQSNLPPSVSPRLPPFDPSRPPSFDATHQSTSNASRPPSSNASRPPSSNALRPPSSNAPRPPSSDASRGMSRPPSSTGMSRPPSSMGGSRPPSSTGPPRPPSVGAPTQYSHHAGVNPPMRPHPPGTAHPSHLASHQPVQSTHRSISGGLFPPPPSQHPGTIRSGASQQGLGLGPPPRPRSSLTVHSSQSVDHGGGYRMPSAGPPAPSNRPRPQQATTQRGRIPSDNHRRHLQHPPEADETSARRLNDQGIFQTLDANRRRGMEYTEGEDDY